MIWALLRRIPLTFWLGLLAAIAAAVSLYALYHSGYTHGEAEVQAKWDKERAELQAALAKEKAREDKIVTRTVIEYRDRVQVVEKQGQEVVREIEKIAPMDSPLLSGAYRVLHDAAAGAEPLPADPAAAVAAADPVEAAALLRTVADNYQSCAVAEERLIALQNLVRDLQRKEPE